MRERPNKARTKVRRYSGFPDRSYLDYAQPFFKCPMLRVIESFIVCKQRQLMLRPRAQLCMYLINSVLMQKFAIVNNCQNGTAFNLERIGVLLRRNAQILTSVGNKTRVSFRSNCVHFVI